MALIDSSHKKDYILAGWLDCMILILLALITQILILINDTKKNTQSEIYDIMLIRLDTLLFRV